MLDFVKFLGLVALILRLFLVVVDKCCFSDALVLVGLANFLTSLIAAD